MSNKKITKVTVNKERFIEVLKYRKCSIRELGRAYSDIGRTEKTIRRCLQSGEMPPELLDVIAKYLNIHPDYLSGVYDQQADRVTDDYLRRIAKSRIKPGKYPYILKESSDALSEENYRQFFKDVLSINQISTQQFLTLPVEERVIFREEIVAAILEVINKHFKYNSLGESIADNLGYALSMIGDMDNRLAQMEGIFLDEPNFADFDDDELSKWEAEMKLKYGIQDE
jgi:septum formation topological specificity factor MinE